MIVPVCVGMNSSPLSRFTAVKDSFLVVLFTIILLLRSIAFEEGHHPIWKLVLELLSRNFEVIRMLWQRAA